MFPRDLYFLNVLFTKDNLLFILLGDLKGSMPMSDLLVTVEIIKHFMPVETNNYNPINIFIAVCLNLVYSTLSNKDPKIIIIIFKSWRLSTLAIKIDRLDRTDRSKIYP